MRYEDRAVVSRHNERLLAELAENRRHVTYYPARTRPFDLVTLYRKMVAGSTDDVVVGELQAVRYTEGYPLLLGLAVALWIAASPARFPWTRAALCGILLVSGCRRQADEEAEAEFQAKFLRGTELLQYAQEQSEADVQAGRLLLEEAREQFLDAGLLKPGDRATAREITAATRRLRQLDAAIAEQRAREQERHADLAELVRRLQGLTDRQRQLSQQSRQVLLRRPVLTRDELDRLASPVAEAQRAVREATARVLDTVAFQRDTLRELLRRAYGDVGGLPPTEFDPPASQLAVAIKAQERALSSLAAGSVRWPRANTALHAAAGRMQDALDLLRGQLPPETDTADRRKPARNDRDGDHEPAEDGSSADDQQTPSESPGDFSTALSLRSLPVPNQTSAEILAEEVANQTQRAQQKAARAGSRVEKNW